MRYEEHPLHPSLPWRASSAFIIAATGVLSRAFILGANKTEIRGLDGFLRLLDQRRDVKRRERGLITVSNHVSVLDDPLIWGVLPFRHLSSPDNMRWSLGSHDLCFPNKPLSTFFSLGQVLPTHRLRHSPHGGPFQPTITQTIRLLSRGPFHPPEDPPDPARASLSSPDMIDPFSSAQLTYSTNGTDTFPAPSAYQNRRHAWVHIFPEGKVYQKQDKSMRYFKWGVARLILESEPCPDVVPIWIEGPELLMPENRAFPRFLPRPFQPISIAFGEKVDTDAVFGDLRERWKALRERENELLGDDLEIGILTEKLKYGQEAVGLRKECTLRVREEVLKIRRARGWPEEDPKSSLAETYALKGPEGDAGDRGRATDK